MTMRTGTGFDIHRFARRRRLVLGGVCLRPTGGLEGHSDADVLCHAVMDALLGAMALGDIGQLFPNTDPAWKDADSLDLLRKVGRRLAGRGARAVNVDATLIAQGPRLSPYFAAMRANMARALGLDVSRVSVKATTPEGLGALGRREGIAAMAVATVEDAGRRSPRRRGRRKPGPRSP